MNRLHPARRTAPLSDSLLGRLNTYTLAAVAGLGALTVAQPAEARIFYVRINTPLQPNPYPLIFEDSAPAFILSNVGWVYSVNTWGSILQLYIGSKLPNQAYGRQVPSALPAGVEIGPNAHFVGGRLLGLAGDVHKNNHIYYSYKFANGGKGFKEKYLGLKFLKKGSYHYGWARLSVSFPNGGVIARLTGYAYETIPNKAIVTGRTKGPEDSDVEDSAVGEPNLAALNESTLQPASLGLLALGSEGLAIWRREESVPTAPEPK